MKAAQYRQEVYRLRSHPGTASHQARTVILDDRDSFSGVYFSLIPFLGLELFAEMSLTSLPGGLVFPTGFFLFWAFYFTYYRPDHLENHLASRKSWSLAGVPSIVLGALIWLIKMTVVELGEVLLFRWWNSQPPTPPSIRYQPVSARVNTAPRARAATATQPPPQPPPLPEDVRRALLILGLPETRDWNQIHRRYRELAKKFHPDLNPESTTAGTRFMVYDAAYKKLSSNKLHFFTQKAA